MSIPLGLSSLVPGGLGIPSVSSSTPSLFNTNGITLGKIPLQLLTLFPPTGYVGLNLSAVNLQITTAIKAATYGLGIVIGIYANRLYINEVAKFLSFVLTFFPPWYIFDCIQVLSGDDFDTRGFALPVSIDIIPHGGWNGNSWVLTLPLLSLILGTISVAGFAAVTAFVPPEIIKSYGKYIQYGTGASAALFGLIGISSLFALKPPTSVTSVQPVLQQQQGGGRKTLPPLSSFIDNYVVHPSTTKYKEAVPFLGILALIILGGTSISFLRSKQNV